MKTPPISKEELNQLYEDNKSIHKVGDLLNKSGDTISRWLKFYQIKIFNDPKRYDHLRNIPILQNQKDFIIGSLLGDGSIAKNRNKARLKFCHSIKQIEYLQWKKDILNNLVTQNIHEYKQKTRNSTIVSFQTITHQYFLEIQNMFYDGKIKIIPYNIKNIISELSLAVWFMDDGWRHQKWRKAIFCTDCFDINYVKLLTNTLNDKFNIISKIDKQNRIVIYGKEVDTLSDVIKPYIIPSMMYKLGL